MYVCMYMCICVCRFSRYNNINGPTYAFTKICTVCMYVCMYVCIHISYCINVLYVYINVWGYSLHVFMYMYKRLKHMLMYVCFEKQQRTATGN